MDLDPKTLAPRDAYGMLISCVIPRPIAWTSTLAEDGTANLAPFSFFGGVCTDPMTVMVSVGRRRGEPKDTGRNLLANREAVIHIAHRPLAAKMVGTSAEAAPDVDEFELVGLTKADSVKVAPPRVAEAAVALEAVVARHMEVGNKPVDLFLMEVVHIHVDDAYVVDGRPDPGQLAAVGRLGGTHYCDTAAPFDVPRPG